MNSDIRIPVSFRDHRKRRKLNLALGVPECAGFLVDLWLCAAMNRPKGVLYDMDASDIAIDAGWEGDPDFFVEALVKCGFLDVEDDGLYMLHDWEDHQPYAMGAPERSARAKRAVSCRRDRGADGAKSGGTDSQNEGGKNSKGDSDVLDCGDGCTKTEFEYNSDADLAELNFDLSCTPSPSPSPDPSPVPKPKDQNIMAPSGADGSCEAKAVSVFEGYPSEFEAFWLAYPPERRLKKRGALRCWLALLKKRASSGGVVTAAELVRSAQNYAASCARKRTGPDYIMHPTTFLGPQEPWKDYISPPVEGVCASPRSDGVVGRLSKAEEARQRERFERYQSVSSGVAS